MQDVLKNSVRTDSLQSKGQPILRYQLENVECFKYLGSLLTNDGRCTREIKSRIVMA